MASSPEAAAGSGPMYWEGIYWEGFSPEKINAVELKTAAADGDEVLNAVIDQCRKRIEEEDGVDVDDFFLTLEEEPVEKPSGNQSQGPTESKAPSSSSSEEDDNATIVCHLWHINVFKGATESGTADPGVLCRDYLFDKTGKFLLQRKLGS